VNISAVTVYLICFHLTFDWLDPISKLYNTLFSFSNTIQRLSVANNHIQQCTVVLDFASNFAWSYGGLEMGYK